VLHSVTHCEPDCHSPVSQASLLAVVRATRPRMSGARLRGGDRLSGVAHACGPVALASGEQLLNDIKHAIALLNPFAPCAGGDAGASDSKRQCSLGQGGEADSRRRARGAGGVAAAQIEREAPSPEAAAQAQEWVARGALYLQLVVAISEADRERSAAARAARGATAAREEDDSVLRVAIGEGVLGCMGSEERARVRRLEELLDHVLAAGEAARDGAVRALLGALLREVLVAFRQDWPVLCALLAKRLQAGARADLLLAKWAGAKRVGRAARIQDPSSVQLALSPARAQMLLVAALLACDGHRADVAPAPGATGAPALGPTWVLDLAGAIVPAKSLEGGGARADARSVGAWCAELTQEACRAGGAVGESDTGVGREVRAMVLLFAVRAALLLHGSSEPSRLARDGRGSEGRARGGACFGDKTEAVERFLDGEMQLWRGKRAGWSGNEAELASLTEGLLAKLAPSLVQRRVDSEPGDQVA
jgi:hypothetical protein